MMELACVMNFISHDTAYSLYPFSTFCDHRSILWGILSLREELMADKYNVHSWEVVRFLREDHTLPFELGVGERKVGDALCWCFNLDSGERADEDSLMGQGCSWSVEYSMVKVQLIRGGIHQTEDAFWG